MVDEELKEAIADLKKSTDNLEFSIKQLHEGDRGLMELVDKIGILIKQ